MSSTHDSSLRLRPPPVYRILARDPMRCSAGGEVESTEAKRWRFTRPHVEHRYGTWRPLLSQLICDALLPSASKHLQKPIGRKSAARATGKKSQCLMKVHKHAMRPSKTSLGLCNGKVCTPLKCSHKLIWLAARLPGQFCCKQHTQETKH